MPLRAPQRLKARRRGAEDWCESRSGLASSLVSAAKRNGLDSGEPLTTSEARFLNLLASPPRASVKPAAQSSP